MSLTSNPFHILGAKMTDDRRRIIALAKEKSFGGDEEAVREAQSILLTPRKRLAAEIAWLPGVEPEQIGELLWTTEASWRAVTAWTTGWNTPSLAGANLLAHMGHYVDDNSLAWWVSLLAAAQQRVQADDVTALVNEARVAAGLPRASKQDVTEELQDRANSYRNTIERCLDTLATQRMAVVVTSVVNTATRNGSTHAPPLVDTLIDSYYDRRVSGTMDERRKGIANLAARVRADASGGRIARVPAIVGEIERALRAWDVLAQPIQVSLASRGMSHPPSDEIMRDTRSLAVFLINEHGVVFLEVAQSLTKTLRKVFAEMEPITELLDKDAATLDGIAAKVRTAQPRTVREETPPAGELDIAALGVKGAAGMGRAPANWVIDEPLDREGNPSDPFVRLGFRHDGPRPRDDDPRDQELTDVWLQRRAQAEGNPDAQADYDHAYSQIVANRSAIHQQLDQQAEVEAAVEQGAKEDIKSSNG